MSPTCRWPPTTGWVQVRESATVIKVNKRCSCYEEVSEPELPKFLMSGTPKIWGQELRTFATHNPETRKAKTPELGNSETTVFLCLSTPLPPDQSTSWVEKLELLTWGIPKPGTPNLGTPKSGTPKSGTPKTSTLPQKLLTTMKEGFAVVKI